MFLAYVCLSSGCASQHILATHKECCGRKGIRHKHTLGCMAGLLLLSSVWLLQAC